MTMEWPFLSKIMPPTSKEDLSKGHWKPFLKSSFFFFFLSFPLFEGGWVTLREQWLAHIYSRSALHPALLQKKGLGRSQGPRKSYFSMPCSCCFSSPCAQMQEDNIFHCCSPCAAVLLHTACEVH